MPIVIGNMTAYDLKEVAELMGISLQTVRIYVRKSLLKAVKVGAKFYVQDKALKTLFEKGTHQPVRKKKTKKKPSKGQNHQLPMRKEDDSKKRRN